MKQKPSELFEGPQSSLRKAYDEVVNVENRTGSTEKPKQRQ